MVIYEVNLKIDSSVYNDFIMWHKGHMAELIALPGFEKAILYKDGEDPSCISVQYHLKNMDALDHYSTHHAPKLQAEGEQKFSGKVTVSRRILQKESMMEAQI